MDVTLRPTVEPGLGDSKTQQTQPLSELHLREQAPRPTGALAKLGPAAVLGSLDIRLRGHLEQALRLDPTAVRPRVLLFLLELQDQKFAAAEHIVTALLREHPQEPDYLAMHAELKLRTIELPQSRQLAAQALQLDPEHVEAQRVKDLLDIVSGEHAPNEHTLTRLIEQNPNDRQVLFTLFQSLVERHRLDEATRLGQQLQRAEPHNAALTAALIDLRIFSQLLGLPSYQLRKAGWLGTVVITFLSVATFKLLADVDNAVSTVFLSALLTFLIYTLIYPTLMRRWFRTQGL